MVRLCKVSFAVTVAAFILLLPIEGHSTKLSARKAGAKCIFRLPSSSCFSLNEILLNIFSTKNKRFISNR